MYPWSQAVLAYQITGTNATDAALRTAMQNVPLAYGEMALIGGTLVSDVTTVGLSHVVTRTLTFALGAQFNANLQAGSDPKAPFNNLYTASIGLGIDGIGPNQVTALAPVVT